ncbi:MAG TPA: hypothetical protein VHF26_20050 [Trebonia sp.]|nr:hypothetical protein [Trebonia sp.]
MHALKARALIALGRLGEALGWARDHGLEAGDKLSYLRESEYITLARLLLARSPDGAGEGAALGVNTQSSGWSVVATVPVVAWELSLGIWMTVRGFRPSPLTTAAPAGTRPAYQ